MSDASVPLHLSPDFAVFDEIVLVLLTRIEVPDGIVCPKANTLVRASASANVFNVFIFEQPPLIA
jgi:hypothetical protein